MKFGRVLTAMVTPFTDNGEVDYAEVKRLAVHLMENGNLTRAAALIFHPHPERFYPGCYVKIGRFF